MAKEVAPNPRGREFDHLLACGEQIAVSMVALALQARGVPAVSLTASQCGIHTDGSFNRARIRDVETRRLVAELQAGKVVIVAGFQGINGGSRRHDARDVAAATSPARRSRRRCRRRSTRTARTSTACYTADPRVVPNARQIPHLSYEECIELAASGAKVLHPRAVEICYAIQRAHSRPLDAWRRRGNLGA